MTTGSLRLLLLKEARENLPCLFHLPHNDIPFEEIIEKKIT
jgi:hypothetical protein